jgi:hypothetical protein
MQTISLMIGLSFLVSKILRSVVVVTTFYHDLDQKSMDVQQWTTRIARQMGWDDGSAASVQPRALRRRPTLPLKWKRS